MQFYNTVDKMVIDMEHKKDEAKLSSSDLTTANYVNDHLLDRVRHLQKTEPTDASGTISNTHYFGI